MNEALININHQIKKEAYEITHWSLCHRPERNIICISLLRRLSRSCPAYRQAGSPAMTLHLYRHTMHRSRHFFYKAGVFFNGIANNNNIGTSFTVEVGFFGFNNAAANY